MQRRPTCVPDVSRSKTNRPEKELEQVSELAASSPPRVHEGSLITVKRAQSVRRQNSRACVLLEALGSLVPREPLDPLTLDASPQFNPSGSTIVPLLLRRLNAAFLRFGLSTTSRALDRVNPVHKLRLEPVGER